jgi:hypothetical protein
MWQAAQLTKRVELGRGQQRERKFEKVASGH